MSDAKSHVQTGMNRDMRTSLEEQSDIRGTLSGTDLQRKASDRGCARVGEGGGDVSGGRLPRRFAEGKANPDAILVEHRDRGKGRGSRSSRYGKRGTQVGQRV